VRWLTLREWNSDNYLEKRRRPKIVDVELLECDNEKCQREMRTPIPLK
jgi:hypothetical protein